MKKPWSISTTLRNPDRLRSFLEVLKELEGKTFDEACQTKFQILLIKNKVYKPNNIPSKYRPFFEDPMKELSFEVAQKIFELQNYESPPMRGRQSANPLNKLGFAVARQGEGPIIITDLGNKFLSKNIDIGEIFFKSLLKLQFPNPWADDFSTGEGFDISPLIASLILIRTLNERSNKKGISKQEFSIFVQTLINAKNINKQVETIINYRKSRNKEEFIVNYLKKFYGMNIVPRKKISNLLDYGDNTIRYFRLTRLFKAKTDPFGHHLSLDIEDSRLEEVDQLVKINNGQALKFGSIREYRNYLENLNLPKLPWDEVDNLKNIATFLQNYIKELRKQNKFTITHVDRVTIERNLSGSNKDELKVAIRELRKVLQKRNESLQKISLRGNFEALKEFSNILKDARAIRKYQPEQFEKFLKEILEIIDDEILIKANYPTDDEGEPISHAPGGVGDIEAFYKKFNVLCEVTLNASNFQWIQEGQPIMRHLRTFEKIGSDKETFCLFIAPRIHTDTYSQYWTAVKYEYDGIAQKIIPLTCEQLAKVLEVILYINNKHKKVSNEILYGLYTSVTNVKGVNGFNEWKGHIEKKLAQWNIKYTNGS